MNTHSSPNSMLRSCRFAHQLHEHGARPGAVLVAIKVIHTLAWFSIESCMVYLLSAGFAKRSDRRAALAAAVVGGESLIFAANGFRCPLTQLADSLGAERGSVTDIYLPGWFAHNLPAIHAPLLVLAACLHGRNLWQQRSGGWSLVRCAGLLLRDVKEQRGGCLLPERREHR